MKNSIICGLLVFSYLGISNNQFPFPLVNCSLPAEYLNVDYGSVDCTHNSDERDSGQCFWNDGVTPCTTLQYWYSYFNNPAGTPNILIENNYEYCDIGSRCKRVFDTHVDTFLCDAPVE